jgi:hypothetical protein
MKTLTMAALASVALILVAKTGVADEVTPGLANQTIQDDAEDELLTLMRSLEPAEQRALQGIYVAVDPSTTDPLALPACDDDGDYVVVVSRAMLELVQQVAYTDASDRLRSTHLRGAYGPLLARAQLPGAPLLPPPPAPLAPEMTAVPLAEATDAFAHDALAWLVADEVAHALAGDVVCPHPTVTHEHADDEWTPEEHAMALELAPARMKGMAASDASATSRVLAAGRSDVPAIELLTVLAAFEDARPEGAAWTYLTLHPHASERAETVRQTERRWQGAHPRESSPVRKGMR